ncbi:hypothetical protein N0V85_001744 [Neurospora sp. IMI 360204]|nr:hypothetical protein N0V85_001744 [Neurospora sp. IMI 360204]
MPYHRWLVARNDLARVDPRYPYPQTTFQPYGNPHGPQQQPYGNYGMHPVPPPVYDPDAPRPPMYPGPPPMAMVQPPDGATKVDPMQQAPAPASVPVLPPLYSGRNDGNGGGGEQYEAPLGPPPSAQAQVQGPIRQQGTGGTNPFRG